jgi:hypothetical protein
MSAQTLTIACTVCDSPASASIRDALIQDADLARNLLAVVLPWVMCLGVVALLHVTRTRAEDRQ